MPQRNLAILNRTKPIEVVLELNSFAGGENTIGEDSELKNNEARVIKNWDVLSLGGMIRSKGFNEVADGGASYSEDLDLVIEHKEGANTEIYGVIEGDLVKKNSVVLAQDDAAAFTSGVLCHGVSAGDKLWITNATDNLKYKTISGSVTTPSDQPSSARDRIYFHKFRLVAEGGDKTIYGSRAGSGNWTSADAWSLANDAWNIDLPEDTKGCVVGFPSGPEVTVFTYYQAYSLFNMPDIKYRGITNSRGCCAPYSIAKGNEGVFFLSNHPTLGVFLWDGANWIELTVNHDFVEDIDLSYRVFGAYRNRRYYLFYTEEGSGVTYPNRLRIYDAEWGRWMERPVSSDLSDNLGYPALLRYTNNELYVGSSQKDKLYELETDDNSDEDNNTEAEYKTKEFTSADFVLSQGDGQFPIDEVRLKLIKMTIVYSGSTGSVSVQWSADKGKYSGSQIVTLIADGDLINSTFTVNTSKVVTSPPHRNKSFTFNNSAVGRRFNFQILNTATGERPKIHKIKIIAIVLNE